MTFPSTSFDNPSTAPLRGALRVTKLRVTKLTMAFPSSSFDILRQAQDDKGQAQGDKGQAQGDKA
jgi:hypothetical protein